MSSNEEIRNFVMDTVYNLGFEGKPLPTFKIIAEICESCNIKSPKENKIEISTLQYIFSEKKFLNDRWSEGRKIFEINKKEVDVKEIQKVNEYENERIQRWNKLKEFFLSICEEAGSKNLKLPSMMDLVNHANIRNLTTPLGKEITTSTVQKLITTDERHAAWNKGKKENIPEGEVFFQQAEANTYNAIIMYVEGNGFLQYEKPTLSKICKYLNECGYRTETRLAEWSDSTLFRYLHSMKIDVQELWQKGINRGKEALGQNITIPQAIRKAAYDWGLNGGLVCPNIPQIAERLYAMKFQTDKGKRLSAAYLSSVMVDNGINLWIEWDRGFNDRKATLQQNGFAPVEPTSSSIALKVSLKGVRLPDETQFLPLYIGDDGPESTTDERQERTPSSTAQPPGWLQEWTHFEEEDS